MRRLLQIVLGLVLLLRAAFVSRTAGGPVLAATRDSVEENHGGFYG